MVGDQCIFISYRSEIILAVILQDPVSFNEGPVFFNDENIQSLDVSLCDCGILRQVCVLKRYLAQGG